MTNTNSNRGKDKALKHEESEREREEKERSSSAKEKNKAHETNGFVLLMHARMQRKGSESSNNTHEYKMSAWCPLFPVPPNTYFPFALMTESWREGNIAGVTITDKRAKLPWKGRSAHMHARRHALLRSLPLAGETAAELGSSEMLSAPLHTISQLFFLFECSPCGIAQKAAGP